MRLTRFLDDKTVKRIKNAFFVDISDLLDLVKSLLKSHVNTEKVLRLTC